LTPAAVASACDLQVARPVRIVLKRKEGIEMEQAAPEMRQTELQSLAAIASRRMRTLGVA
jgi:hypothetical protein